MLSAQHLTRSGKKTNMENYNSLTRGVTAIYSQDFEGDFPANMTIIDVDKNTPNAKVAKYGQSWSKQVISGMNMAAVTSWFTPAGTANDWMITPAIDLTTDNKLVWTAASLDKDYKESYKVWISTTAPNAASFDASKFTLLKDVKKEEASLTTHVIDLKAKGYENTKVWIAFQMVSNDCYVLVLDNILVGKFDGIDCSNVSSLFDQSIKLNKEVVIKGAVRNKLMEPVTSVELTWYVEGSSDKHNQTFSGLNLAYMQAQEFTFTDKYTGTKNGEETIIVEIVKVNNAVDEDNTNNKKSFKVETIETPVPRKVLIEEATGAWCGFCPDGALVLKDIISKNKNVIGVAAHSGDNMEIPETKELCGTLGAGFPSGMINRTQFGGKTGISRSEWKANAEAMIANMPTSVSIELTTSYNASTKEVTADIKTNFANEKKGDFRINLYIVENKVTGTGTGWDQANYYDNAAQFPGHPLNGKGNPIKGYVHNHVIRKMVGGTWGTDGIIPDVAKGDYTHQYKVTLDNGWKPEDIHIVATVSEYGDSKFSRKIFNAEETILVKAKEPSFELYKDGNKVDINNPIVINGKASDNELKYAFKAKNISSSEVKVKLKREILSATKEHSFYFCWKDCYQPTVTESAEMTIAAGAEHADELSLHLEPKGTAGTSKYKVQLVNSADADDKIEFEVHFVAADNTAPAQKSFEIYKDGNKVDLSNPIVIAGKSTDNELKYAFKAKNTSSSEVKVKMKREIVSATKEHSFYFCWKDCYQPTVTETSEMTIAAGAEHADELSLHLEPKGTAGTSKYKVILVNTADANDKLEFEVHFDVTKKTTDNIVSADKIGLEQYPNPAKDVVNVNFNINKTLNAEPVINIYNLYGKLVKVVKVNARSGYVTNAINCSDLASGMYTYRIVMGDQSYTGKIIKE
jgi:CheY-specific phosphatase CheX